MLDLLFFKDREHLLKSLNIYFSKESSVTQISVSGRPWNDLFLDGGFFRQIHVILGVLDMKSLRTTDLEEVFRRQNRRQNIHFHDFSFR